MLKLLQVESQGYFRNRSYAQIYSTLKSFGERTTFYTMLTAAHLCSNVELAVNYLAQASTARHLDTGALLSALWGLSMQMSENSEEAKKLFSLISIIHARNIIDKSQLLADLPEWVGQGAGLIEGATLQRRIARVYTKINYEQSKYSLLRENNEGYAKMTLLLINLRDSHPVESVWHRMLDLVGNFDLDPDRVLDLIIEARVHNPTTHHYIKLLNQFRRESITAILGNKLKLVKGKSIDCSLFQKLVYVGPMETFESTVENGEQIISPHLISMCAQLIKDGILLYQDVLPYLEPSDYSIKLINSKRADLALQKIKECFTLNTEELDETQKAKLYQEESLKFEGQLLHSTKLALISELLRLNDWSDFEAAWIPYKNNIDLLLYQPLLKHLLDLVQWSIEPLSRPVGYQRFFRFQNKGLFYTGDGSTKEQGRIETLQEGGLAKLNHLLSFVNKYIGLRPRLFIKLCRIFKEQAKQGKGEQLKPLIKDYLVMGSCIAQNNAPISIELFDLLQCYNYQFRYDCYMTIYQGGMSDCPFVARIFESVKRKQNIIVNNLSKENKKLFIRKITKLTHNQALPVFYWIVRRIVMEDYEAVVPEIVAVICNCSPMTLDIAIFIMLYTLNQNKQPPVNPKTHQCYAWFKNVTTFISNFFRKYLQCDIQPVFDYIIMKTGKLPEMEDDELPGDLLKLLHQILNKMHGSVMISEVNKTKYDAIAAGPKLQAEILQLTSEVRAAKKSKVLLQKFFWEQNAVYENGFSLAFNLIVLLAQKRAEVFTKSFIDDIKIVGQIFDEYSLLIMQIVRVLLYQAQDYSHYAQLLPANAMEVMVKDYKLPLEIVCEVVRPGVKHIAMMNNEEWTHLTNEFSNAYQSCLKDEKYLVKSTRIGQKWSALLSSYKEKVLQYIPIPFFTAFWFLTLDSVYFPAKSYSEKIEDLKKKIEPNKKGQRANQRQVERMKTLYDKLIKEQQAQRKKHNQTLSEQNLKKLDIELLHGMTDKGKDAILVFAQQFVQSCLLPRMMLDRTEALYCVKFTIQMIKANKMAVTKSIRLLTYLIEFVMGYLPFTTHRQASNCISVFLAQILVIFNNWNDPVKLKQDLKNILGVEDAAGKDNYPKLKDYLIKLYERVGTTLRGVKEEPYLIKNCLYILQKVDSIPCYKQQADELAQHMNDLKQMYPTVDMRTSLDRQIAMLTSKKNDLPDRPEKQEQKKANLKQEAPKQVTKITASTNKSPIPHPPIANNSSKKQPQPKLVELKPTEIIKITENRPLEKMAVEQRPKPRFTSEKPVNDKRNEDRIQQKKQQIPKRQQVRNPLTGSTISAPQLSRFTDQKIQPKPIAPPKTVKQRRQQMQRQNAFSVNQTPSQAERVPANVFVPTFGSPIGVGSVQPAVSIVPGDSSQANAAKPSQQQECRPIIGPVPLRSQRLDSSAIVPIEQTTPQNKIPKPLQKPQQEQEKIPQRKQSNQPAKTQQKNSPPLQKIDRQYKQKLEKKSKHSPTPQRKKQDRWKDKDHPSHVRKGQLREGNKDYRDRQANRDKDIKDNRESNRESNRDRDNRDKDRETKPKNTTYTYTREPIKQDQKEEGRRQERRDKSKERDKDRQREKEKQRQKDKQRERQREREKERQREKDKQRRYDKYHRSRSRQKYGRR